MEIGGLGPLTPRPANTKHTHNTTHIARADHKHGGFGELALLNPEVPCSTVHSQSKLVTPGCFLIDPAVVLFPEGNCLFCLTNANWAIPPSSPLHLHMTPTRYPHGHIKYLGHSHLDTRVSGTPVSSVSTHYSTAPDLVQIWQFWPLAANLHGHERHVAGWYVTPY